MSTTVPVGDGIPAAFYRNAIDLNRFSNSVSKKLVTSYNNVILKAVEQLEKIEKQPLNKRPAYKTARLRALIKQTKESLNTWADGSVQELISELEGVAKVQAGFIEKQIKNSIPKGMTEKIVDEIGYSVRSVAVSPSFAKSVVNTDPTALNLSVLRSDLAGAKAPKGTFKLTAKEGQTITLPNGNTVKKSFRELAAAEAKRLNQVVRTGLLSGNTTPEIVKELVGNLQKDQKGSLSQLLAQGGAVTKRANSQVTTIVRTTVNQVTNTASQAVYKANPDVTEEYRYVATLDSRTSPVCRDLDGQVFKYNEGPVPPQHFGCRSTTVAVVNYKKWGFTPPPVGKRASADGPVPANTTYGKWLYGERVKGSKFKPGKEQIAALGEQKAKYFNRLSNKYGPDQALKKLIREDNTEVSLAQLQKRYGNPEDIKLKTKAKKTKLISDKEKKTFEDLTKLEKQNAEILKKIGADPTTIATLSKQLAKKQPQIDWDAISKSPKTKASLAKSKKLSKEISEIGKKPKLVPITAEQKKLIEKEVQAKYEIKKPSAALIKKEGKYMTAAQKAGKQKYIPLTPAQKQLIDDSLENLGLQGEYDLANKKVFAIRNREEYLRQAKENESKIKKLKSEFTKGTTKKIKNNDYIYYGEDLIDDKWVKVGSERIKNMGYKIDNKMLSGKKLKGWSSEFEQLEKYITAWKGGSSSTQMAQAYQLEKAGYKLSTFAKYKAKSAKNWSVANRNRFIKQAEGLEEFIKKAPSYDGEIHRGMQIRKDRFNEFLEDLATGKPTATLESWSSKIDIADDFAGVKRIKGKIGPDGEFDDERIHAMLTVRKNKYGSSITRLSNTFKHESEVLIPSKLRYKIVDIEQTPIGKTGEMFWNIVLEQI